MATVNYTEVLPFHNNENVTYYHEIKHSDDMGKSTEITRYNSNLVKRGRKSIDLYKPLTNQCVYMCFKTSYCVACNYFTR
jgi:hypothetical protein